MPRVSREQAKLNRQTVVEAAAALFRERGLHGVGVADIMAQAGLTHGGFYGQFASRDALAGEAVACALEQERGGALDALVALYLSGDHLRWPGRGCPLAARVDDVAREAPDSPVRNAFTAGVRRFAETIAALLPRAARERRRVRARATLSTLVGAVVLARAVNDDALGAELIEAARAAVAAPR
ncbi:putative HTH-type transcriptional regulator [Methylobacterium crusticola]|uniref:HTH-type transcriptional regulator n=1 Tax=Methylobacterium crusticola TaxID=1697972 RepID=A0ABQ4R2V5_9HYPH|nr:TetR/AcrR family transcriptional regulator [Methylobacterium crusticola]GJD52005.1 putative HTH-type transcriptional regulator [Methylobacterium crusticola]